MQRVQMKFTAGRIALIALSAFIVLSLIAARFRDAPPGDDPAAVFSTSLPPPDVFEPLDLIAVTPDRLRLYESREGVSGFRLVFGRYKWTITSRGKAAVPLSRTFMGKTADAVLTCSLGGNFESQCDGKGETPFDAYGSKGCIFPADEHSGPLATWKRCRVQFNAETAEGRPIEHIVDAASSMAGWESRFRNGTMPDHQTLHASRDARRAANDSP